MSIANKQIGLACASALVLASGAAGAENPLAAAFGAAKPLVDVRVRYEEVEQAPLTEEAEAGTIRARLGVETGRAWGTALLVEGEFMTPFITDYREDPAVAVNTQYPVVPDPEAYELNRAHLANTSIANTTITLGRQRINLDDQRFIGNVGWRQNEQTFDALRVVNRPGGGNFFVDVTYGNRANRIFGDDSPQGDYKGDLGLVNLAYQFKPGRLTAFAYLLDFDPILPPALGAAANPARLSSETFGLRFAGETPIGKVKLGYAASYALQDDFGDNPLAAATPDTLENDYYLGELYVTFKQFTFLVGDEVLGGNGTTGFSTPLATLHKFQGWADKFLTTPANGIEDRYASFTAAFKAVGPFDTVTFIAAYHDYESARLGIDYGSEINASLAAKWKRFTGMLKYGDYREVDLAFRDTEKLWVQIDFVW